LKVEVDAGGADGEGGGEVERWFWVWGGDGW